MTFNPYIMLSASTLLAVLNNITLHKFGNRGLRNTGDIMLFNSLVSAIWIAVLLAVGRGFSPPSEISVAVGLAYGVFASCFLICKMQSMATGPVSISTLIGCCALLVPTFFGALLWHERVSFSQIAGIALLMCGLFFCSNIKADKAITLKWKLYSAAFFLSGGIVSLLFKFHQSSAGASEYNDMMIIAASTMTLLLFVFSFVVNRVSGRVQPRLGREALLFAPLCGLISCGYNRINIPLTGRLPSVIFFPIFNGGVIILATLCGIVFFREKLAVRQYCGIAVGMFAIMMIGKIIYF